MKLNLWFVYPSIAGWRPWPGRWDQTRLPNKFLGVCVCVSSCVSSCLSSLSLELQASLQIRTQVHWKEGLALVGQALEHLPFSGLRAAQPASHSHSWHVGTGLHVRPICNLFSNCFWEPWTRKEMSFSLSLVSLFLLMYKSAGVRLGTGVKGLLPALDEMHPWS